MLQKEPRNYGQILVKQFDTKDEMGKAAALDAFSAIERLLSKKDEISIIFAAAPSQNDFLRHLINKNIAWDHIHALHMDDYIELNKDAPQRFTHYLKQHIFNKISLKRCDLMEFDGANTESEILRYEKILTNTKLDIAFIGIGENGHIAFNDPSNSNFSDNKLIKIVELEEECRQQQVNDGCFSRLEDVPKLAATVTIPYIMSAEYIFCMVPGKTKAKAVRNTLLGEIGEWCPATILRTHPNVIMYCDKNAGSLIE